MEAVKLPFELTSRLLGYGTEVEETRHEEEEMDEEDYDFSYEDIETKYIGKSEGGSQESSGSGKRKGRKQQIEKLNWDEPDSIKGSEPQPLKEKQGRKQVKLYMLNPLDFLHDPIKQQQIRRAKNTHAHHSKKIRIIQKQGEEILQLHKIIELYKQREQVIKRICKCDEVAKFIAKSQAPSNLLLLGSAQERIRSRSYLMHGNDMDMEPEPLNYLEMKMETNGTSNHSELKRLSQSSSSNGSGDGDDKSVITTSGVRKTSTGSRLDTKQEPKKNSGIRGSLDSDGGSGISSEPSSPSTAGRRNTRKTVTMTRSAKASEPPPPPRKKADISRLPCPQKSPEKQRNGTPSTNSPANNDDEDEEYDDDVDWDNVELEFARVKDYCKRV